jgi:hypothetical protein
MIVTCECGKKLKLNDELLGKKVRCPSCKEVFVARDEGGIQDEPPSPKAQPVGQRKGKVLDEDEDEADDQDLAESTTKKRSRAGLVKKGVPLWRKVASLVVLFALLGVLAVVGWRVFSPKGTVELWFNVVSPEVFIDDKKMDLKGEGQDSMTMALDLVPGEHQIKVSKSGYKTYTKTITLKSGATEKLTVTLERDGK